MCQFIVKKQRSKSSTNQISFPSKIFIFALLILIVIGAILLVLGAFAFGFIGLFKISGVQYNSIYTLLLFLVIFFVIGFIVDFLSIFLIKLFSEQIKSSKRKFLVRMIIDCTFSWFAIHTADELMNSISIPFVTEFVAVFLLFLLEVALDINDRNTTSKKSVDI